MILRIWSDLPGFREAKFEAGMNVVLADRGEDSDENESTNGLGKTTLLRVIQFCLGSDFSREKVLDHPELTGATFGMDFSISGEVFSVFRNTSTSKRVSITATFIVDLKLEFDIVEGGFAQVDIDDWRLALSARLIPDAVVPSANRKFAPSFREVVLYLIRLGKEAYIDPQIAFKSQSGASKRLIISYLLGLNWSAQRELQDTILSRSHVADAMKALKQAEDATDERSIGELEAERVVLESTIKQRQEEVKSFRVRDDYRDLEMRLGQTDRRIHDLINDNHADTKLLAYYVESAQEAPLFDAAKPVEILKNAGAIFTPEALRALADVSDFHRQVYHNRNEFLRAEITRLQSLIASRDHAISDESAIKTELLRVLSSSGVLETFIELQRTTSDLNRSLEALKTRIEERKRFDRRKDELGVKVANTRTLLKQDLEDRRSIVDEVISLFAQYTRFLYKVPGKLSIDVKDSGYHFLFAIERQGSDGVDQMVVFCFDLAVATIRARRHARFLTLTHDSSLFADVDPRQYGLALQLAASVSSKEGFQYICCLNVGALPREHLGDLDVNKVTRLKLTDDSDAGRLLGRRLSPRER
jgi:uncharacterized protein YydD (DUF2326 family)